MNQTITIRLKPYLQEFIRCILHDETLFASRKSVVGAMLTPFIEYAPKDYVFSKQTGPMYITITLPCKLGDKEHRGSALIVSKENQSHFERLLGIYFKDIFFRYVDDKIRYTGEIKKCILMFCSDYNMTFTHINYEMLKKSYYRYKKQLNNQKIFYPNVSLSSPLIFAL